MVNVTNCNRWKENLLRNIIIFFLHEPCDFTSSIESVVDLIVVTTVLFLKSSAEMNTKIAAIVMEAVTTRPQM